MYCTRDNCPGVSPPLQEPGSGGDTPHTKMVARSSDPDDMYLITGEKHFGSCSGIAFFVITIAVTEGEEEPDMFSWT